MVMKKFCYVHLLCLVLYLYNQAYGQNSYYQLDIQDKNIGYIECQPPQADVYRGQKVYRRNVFICIESGENDTESIQESTWYKTSPYQICQYAFGHQTGKFWEERIYSCDNDTLTLNLLRNGKKINEFQLAIKHGAQIVTDYFSLLPLLINRESHPGVVTILDPKQIIPEKNLAPLQQLMLQYTGNRTYTLGTKQYLAKTFVLRWDNKTTMNYWVSPKDGALLRLEEPQSKTLIMLADEGIKRKWHKVEASTTVTFKNDFFPFALEKNYRYMLRYQDKDLGKIEFQIRKSDSDKTCYTVFTKGEIGRPPNAYLFSSETQYDKAWAPLYYYLKETGNIEIHCTFLARGIQEKFVRHPHMMERFIPLEKDFLFLDNNCIQLFAIFLGRLRLAENFNLGLAVFHPRRMECTQGTFRVREKKQEIWIVDFQTPYYTLEMWVNLQGQLIRYIQDKLEITLETK